MREELGLAIKEACLAPFTFASHSYPVFDLLMPLFLCRRWEGVPQPQENQNIAWVKPKDLALNPARYPMPLADIPLIEEIMLTRTTDGWVQALELAGRTRVILVREEGRQGRVVGDWVVV